MKAQLKKWKKQLQKTLSEMEDETYNRNYKFCKKSEIFKDSQRGQDFEFESEALEDLINEVEDIIETVNNLIRS